MIKVTVLPYKDIFCKLYRQLSLKSHWSKLHHMTISRCKGGWEMFFFLLEGPYSCLAKTTYIGYYIRMTWGSFNLAHGTVSGITNVHEK